MKPEFETVVDYVDFEINYAAVSLLFDGNVIYSIHGFVTSQDDVDQLEQSLSKQFASAIGDILQKQNLEHVK